MTLFGHTARMPCLSKRCVSTLVTVCPVRVISIQNTSKNNAIGIKLSLISMSSCINEEGAAMRRQGSTRLGP